MNERVKKMWIKALRSGKYKQAKGCLRDDDRFCCLGVLCDIFGRSRRIKWDGDRFDGERFALPASVREWAGLPLSNPIIRPNTFHESAGGVNDHGGKFPKIADLIEKNL